MARQKPDVKMGPEASLFVCVVVVALGLAACGGGIYAELIKEYKPSEEQQGTLGNVMECMYQKDRVQLIAWASAGSLVLGQLLVSVLGGCVCCCTLTYARGRAHNWSMVLFLFSWVAFYISIICFLSGAYINNYHTSKTYFNYDYDLRRCFHIKDNVYFIAAGTALAATLFSVLYYGQAQKSKYEAWVEQGAPTPRLYSTQTKKSFVIAGPAKKGPLKELEGMEDPLMGADDDNSTYDRNSSL